MKIVAVEKESIASDIGLSVGDALVRINGEPVRDVLDYRFLIAEDRIELEVLQRGERMLFDIEKDYDDELGLSFEEIEIRFCGNDCPFCFVDQNPAGMRDSLYFRDEDFRLSFLSGHYVTLTNLSKRDMDRIVSQRLSPIFVSVHATDPEVRKFLFGIRHEDRLLDKLDFLTGHGIEVHTQIVLCPEVNDGEVLKGTIDDLATFLPHLRSVSVVPVGLTKHRKGLRKLKPVTPQYAVTMLETLEAYAADFRARIDENFVYASDEFYIMAGRELPPSDYYDGFYQKENGVGMVRYLLEEFSRHQRKFPKSLVKPQSCTIVTGTLAGGILQEKILPALNRVENFSAKLEVVVNEFYGESIRVTGLLTGQDIFRHLSRVELGDCVYLPANCLKDNHLFLDDWTVAALSERLQRPVVPIDNDFRRLFVDAD